MNGQRAHQIISLIFSVILILLIKPSFVLAMENTSPNSSLVDSINYQEIEGYWQDINDEYGGYLQEINRLSFKELLHNHDRLSLKALIVSIISYFFQEVIINGKLLIILFLLTIFSTVLQTIHSAFENSAVSQIAYFVVYLVLFFVATNSFVLTFNYASSAINVMSDFILALIPLLLGLISTIGNLLTVSFFHPLIIFIVNITNLIISRFVLTFLLISFLLAMVSFLNEEYKVTYLANLFKNISLGSLGILTTIFLSVMSIQGAVSAVQDGLALKTAKFFTGNFIPVIGKTFTDAVDVVLSASLSLKNSIGVIGVIIISVYAAFPAMKILSIAFIYKFAAAILQPVGDESIVKTLNTISNYTFYILACLLVISFMFFLSIVIIVLASNISMFVK